MAASENKEKPLEEFIRRINYGRILTFPLTNTQEYRNLVSHMLGLLFTKFSPDKAAWRAETTNKLKLMG
jgi:hypothetical protein